LKFSQPFSKELVISKEAQFVFVVKPTIANPIHTGWLASGWETEFLRWHHIGVRKSPLRRL
jgi:hypothetical protein